ncbi:hypothetical protein [Natranaeroarchaeum sulfidigenes]|uniref:DUF1102 family n=1 Tax=Natranaeroarchaeum sulfidigenes TaxID=2784880 RepID=A0A897MNV3_9EURY|nr:hypothetical protein [Natranaeroarchaeum sulfidigenes]QSG01618.1 DUF1102 family [Natranaeroarchaeum sulfidigenes]
MKSNRRSVLIGLGALTVGGGAVFGTGAFSSVEAERQVEVSTEGDAAALLQLEILSDSLHDGADGDGNTIEFNQDSLNTDGVTRFDPGLRIGNDGSEEVTVTISGSDGTAELADSADDDDGNGMYFVTSEVSGDELTVTTEDDRELEVVFVLGDDDDIPGSITVSANTE